MSILKGRGGELPLLAIVLVIIVIIAVVGMVVFFPWKEINVDVTRTVEMAPGTTEVDLNLDQEVGIIEVAFSDTSEDIVMIVEGTLRQNLLASGDPLEIMWSFDLVSERLILNAGVDIASFATTYGNDEIVTKLSIPSRLSAMVNVSGTVGSIELSAADGVSLRGAHLSETTGSVLVRLTDATLSGEFNMQSTTGGCTLEWSDVNIVDFAQVSASCTTGGIIMDVSQANTLGGDLSLAASATTGGIELDLSIEGENSARVVSSTELGNIDVGTLTGFTGSNEDLKSNNYPSEFRMDIAVNTQLGGVSLNLEYLS
ncbi:MAG: hypothetical protein LUQ16_08935 [Methanomassiliicoccales archaeon]|nr:hypothetical protein [Methanomassiliicoccales archaeon]